MMDKMIRKIIKEEINKLPEFCYFSDAGRADLIGEFLKNIEDDEDYNVEEPEFDWLLDPHEGYQDQTYIQNVLESGYIIYWEGWSSLCWEALYQKDEYKGLSKEDAIEKFIKERMPRIAQEFNMAIKDWEWFWHETYEEEVESGYIMKITLSVPSKS